MQGHRPNGVPAVTGQQRLYHREVLAGLLVQPMKVVNHDDAGVCDVW